MMLDLSSLLDNTDECLLNFIQLVTMPIRDGRRKLFTGHSSPVTQDNKMRHLYILCLLLFNTNSSCYMPMHFVLTEAILCYGGSMELVKLFNRFGMVSSLDTNNRIATYIVQKRIIEGIKPSIQFGMLTVVSVDNVDILQSHAVVSALDATRSWHGTSVQCIQPQPKSDELTQQEIVVSSQSQPDDSQSPIPVQRLKRRRRTLAEACSPHTQMVTPRHESTEDTYKAICNELDIQELSCTFLSLNNFLPTETELTHFNQLKVDIHKSMLLKYFRQSDDDQIFHLSTIPVLVNGVRKQVSEKEVGNVVYVDVLSEKADSKATLTKVVGKLHKIFVVDLKQMFVVGDAKVYDVLQSLRLEYGNHLNWLIPLPGDFHILYNYQKVVMKAYGDAGLITLAKSAGYRGETLTSLSKAKHFRRTHLFLLQTYEAFYSFTIPL